MRCPRALRATRFIFRFLALATTLIAPGSAAAQEPTFADVSAVLHARCVMCHSGASAAAGLRLDTLDGLRKGSSKGPVVKSGDPAASELVRRIKGTSQPRMPMTGPPFLSDREIALIERWVATGLAPGAAKAASTAAPPVPALPKPGATVTYTHVAPIFARRCAKCHTENGIMGPAPEGYVLTSYASTLSAADRARVVPGNPAASELVRRLRGQAKPRMPFDGPPYLSGVEIDVITRWVQQGARGSDGKPAALPAGARVRLHGTLASRWRLDDLPITVTSSTRMDKSPAAGDYIQVRGRLSADGAIITERIRRR